MSQAYCNTCKEIVPLNCHIKKAVCKCGSKDLIMACSRWSDKVGWDYFDRAGKFLKFVPHIPYGEPKLLECYFTPSKETTSATICANCGKEKMLHTIGEGLKATKIIIQQLPLFKTEDETR